MAKKKIHLAAISPLSLSFFLPLSNSLSHLKREGGSNSSKIMNKREVYISILKLLVYEISNIYAKS